jgi:flavodoxin
MKIAILVHSQSGKTRKFADTLFDRLSSDGHNVNLTQLETTVPIKGGSVREKLDIGFTNLPSVQDADVILFGGPVWAFGPSPVIIAAMQQIGNMKGKTTLSFCTMGFPYKCMGGNAAIAYMNRVAGTLGAKVLSGSICTNMFKDLSAQITCETERIANLLKP